MMSALCSHASFMDGSGLKHLVTEAFGYPGYLRARCGLLALLLRFRVRGNKDVWVRSFSYNDPSSTSFHRARTRYEMAPGARPCLRKKRRSGKSRRVVLYRCILFPVTATGAVSGHSAANGVTALGQMEEEVAMAMRLSALVPYYDLKCQGYYWRPGFG